MGGEGWLDGGGGDRKTKSCRVEEPGRRRHRSHDRAGLGLLLLEGAGQQLGATGEVQQTLGETPVGPGFVEWLKLVDARQRRGAEHAVDAFLRREGRTLQIGLGSKLLRHGRTLRHQDK